MRRGKHYLLSVFISALLVGLGAAAGMAYNITITGTVVMESELSIGACEGSSGFDINEMLDLGINNYRFFAGMTRLEPEDDDGVYGSPSIAEIKADPNVIPWSTWDYWFTYPDTYFWAKDPDRVMISIYEQLVALRDNNIRPIITLRNVDGSDNPPWAQELNPPDCEADWNEWWEFVFAWVYWANVLNNLEVHDWQVHNEPNNSRQGWGGTLDDYIVFTQYTADAIKYVYDTYLPGKSFRLYAPVTNSVGAYITESIIANDAIIDVVDWHNYGDPRNDAKSIHEKIDLYDSDGVHELLCLSEWGSTKADYDRLSNALNFMKRLMYHSMKPENKVDLSCIFSLYNWGSGFDGIIEPPAYRTETYYAMRLVTRGLQGGRDVYEQVKDVAGEVANAKGSDGTLYVVYSNSSAQAKDITLDVSAHVLSGTATLYEYSANYKDEVTGTVNFTGGIITLTAPKNSITLVKIPT